MVARDFQGEQDYFLSRHQLHNRLFHDWGIVCGLEVRPHNDPDCDDNWVTVCSGIAIDCRGRELILEKKKAVKIWDPPDPKKEGGSESDSSTDAEESEPPPLPGPFLLYLRYGEEEIEPVPVLYAEEGCDPTQKEANRVREVARLEVCAWHDVENTGWRMPGGEKPSTPRCQDDCPGPVPGPVGVCLEPQCPTWDMVPLAVIQPRRVEGGYVIEAEDIDTLGQCRLPVPKEFLTHIVETNWSHGGEVTLSHLRAPVEEGGMGGRLEVRFDRELFQAEDGSNTINEFTFVAQYAGASQAVEFLAYERQHPPDLGETDKCVAVFTIDPDHFYDRRRDLTNTIIYVTLRCDFILDCHELPVDGNHLRGRLPSGNGYQGGIFESWFRVNPDGSESTEEA
jgi:hypothetical protein